MMNAYELEKWGVKVEGPNSVLAAHSFEEAISKANEINQWVVSRINVGEISEYHPIMFAKPFIWNSNYYGDHHPELTDWSDIS